MGADAEVALAMFVRDEQTVQQTYGLVPFKFLKVLSSNVPPLHNAH